jgi:hypothetical protein
MADSENKNRIEDIKRRLYDREDTISNRPHEGVLHPKNFNLAKEWKSTDTKEEAIPNSLDAKKPPMSPFKKFFIFAFVFFIFAIGFSSYMFLRGGISVSNDNIDITVIGNAFTKGGEELPLQIEVTNRNNADLELADLTIEYPKGASDNPSEVIRLPRDTIGTIKKGQSVTRNTKVTLFGDEKSLRNVKISLEYHPEGSNAIFTKEKEYPITISSAPLSLLVDAPDQATSDQAITFKVTATLNTSLPEGNAMLQVSYPNNFIFDSAIPSPSIGNSVWSLSSLSTTAPLSISIKGRLVGQDGDEQVFHVYAGTTTPTNQSVVNVVYNSLLHTMTITKPFLEARILVNSQDLPSYTATGGETINGDVYWTNNLSTRVTDAQIILSLSGNAYDRSGVNPLEGFFDSQNNQIIWDKNTVPDLASIEPGGTGSASFSFKSTSLLGSSIKDPQIALDVSIKGRKPSEGSTFDEVNNFAKKIVKIASDFQIATSPSYLSGALPPKAEAETKYNVTWTLSNSANNITNAQARSVLPIYVKWVGVVKGATNENISYNESTREVIWNIGAVRANTGFESTREATFTLSLTPSTSQVGSVPQLMKNVYLTGTDAFTGTQVKNSKNPITTKLSNDPNFKSGNDRVVE